MATIVTNPFTLIRNAKDLAGKEYNAFAWFQSRVKELGSVGRTPERLMAEVPGRQFVNKLEVGHMYLFGYDAKHKDTLPYWDKYPLILPFSWEGKHFKGFNLHYLPYGARFKLLQRLMDVHANTRLQARDKMKYSYGILKASAEFELLKPCIKMYLIPHIRSQFMKIYPKDWLTAVMLPVDRFQKANKQTVWRDSMRKA